MVPCVLIPFDRREALTLAQAAEIAGRSIETIRRWASLEDIGRRIGGQWAVSHVALLMFLDGDRAALRAYHAGDRAGSTVSVLFRAGGPRTMIEDAVPLSGFVFDEDSPFTTAEKHRLSAVRLFEFASDLARMAGEATLSDPQNVEQATGLYTASAQILAQANDHLFLHLMVRDCEGEG